MLAIEIDHVHKSYSGLPVLRGLNLAVGVGQVYGLLGPNGVGKSTLLHLLLGFLRPQQGRIRVLGSADLDSVRSRIGYLPERLRYHLRYTGREYMRYLCAFNDLTGPDVRRRIDAELEAVGLSGAADRMLSTYSKGMLQRLGIAQALIHDPELLLIDEPTAGLDPAGQREMLDLLATIRSRGHTIFLTTHFLGEVEHLCDRVGILFNGTLATEADVATLRSPGRNVVISVAELDTELMTRLEQLSPAVRCNRREILLQPNDAKLQAQVLRALLDADVTIIAVEPQGRPLEELYLQIVRSETVPGDGLPGDTAAAEPEQSRPPDSLFAPPGHPDTQPAPAERPRGDTLLRDLLDRNGAEEPEREL